MHGKTKSFFEDILVLIIIALISVGAYIFFFTKDTTKSTIDNTDTVQFQSTQKEQESLAGNTIEIKEIEKTEISINEASQDKPQNTDTLNEKKNIEKIEVKEINNKNTIQEQENNKVVKNQNEVLVPTVDVSLLQKFLIQTKQKIKKAIILSNKNNKKEETLSLRVTVLKNGSFEQLIFTDGNRELFKNNYENIAQVFPVNIDEKIIGEFPRYLRYNFKFTLKEE